MNKMFSGVSTSSFFRWMGFCAVCFVVTIHLPESAVQRFFHDWLAVWAVPWFFFASGFWSAGRAIGWRRIKSLLIPYLLANGIWFAWMAVVEYAGCRFLGCSPSRFGVSLENVMAAFGITSLYPALVPTWFLRALLAFGLLAVPVNLLAKKSRFVVVVLSGIVLVAHFWLWRNVSAAGREFLTFGFPLLGFSCFILGIAMGWGHNSSRSKLPNGLAGVACRNTFAVYLLHVPILLTLSYALRPLGWWEWSKTGVGFVLLWTGIVLAAIGAAEGLRRFAPGFASWLYGGR